MEQDVPDKFIRGTAEKLVASVQIPSPRLRLEKYDYYILMALGHLVAADHAKLGALIDQSNLCSVAVGVPTEFRAMATSE
jgi:hypothetical protein